MWPFTEWAREAVPATADEIAAIRDLERRLGRKLRDGEHVEWVGIWNRRLELG